MRRKKSTLARSGSHLRFSAREYVHVTSASVRENGQCIHAHTMITSMSSAWEWQKYPCPDDEHPCPHDDYLRPCYQCLRMARASMPARSARPRSHTLVRWHLESTWLALELCLPWNRNKKIMCLISSWVLYEQNKSHSQGDLEKLATIAGPDYASWM